MWTAGSISSDSDWKPQRSQKALSWDGGHACSPTTAANIRKRPFGLTAQKKGDEPRVCHREKNRPGLRAPVQAARPRPPFVKTQSGYPGGLRGESLPSLFGSTQAATHRKSPLFLLPASSL